MIEPKPGEQNPTEKSEQTLADAVRVVRKAISDEEDHLKEIANGQDEEPIMLEGETSAGYIVHVMADPAKVARIMLDFQHPLFKVLGEDSPQDMWDELARMVGLESVYSVDM